MQIKKNLKKKQDGFSRSIDDKFIAGVCGGIAQYLKIDSIWVRLIFVLLAFADGVGVLIYIIFWIFLPKASGSNTGTLSKKKSKIS
jgi:phage shock protein PspC (stress-responsive transcriptional regulator)